MKNPKNPTPNEANGEHARSWHTGWREVAFQQHKKERPPCGDPQTLAATDAVDVDDPAGGVLGNDETAATRDTTP